MKKETDRGLPTESEWQRHEAERPSINATALIAEDEQLLGDSLQEGLARQWPTLQIVANVRQGSAAVEQALALRPDVLFLDIRMPAMSGLEVAQALAEEWESTAVFPLIVFVTAYDQYAVQAFQHSAVDYLIKPVLPDRLAQTCARLQTVLGERRKAHRPAPEILESTLAQLRSLLAATGMAVETAPPPLTVIQASLGSAVQMVPVADVVYFQAEDKCVRVVTETREYVIRWSLRQLLPRLDPQRFWQIHRSTVVRIDTIDAARRDESGKIYLELHARKERLLVSRFYAHRFRGM